jgi:hypothetical protein
LREIPNIIRLLVVATVCTHVLSDDSSSTTDVTSAADRFPELNWISRGSSGIAHKSDFKFCIFQLTSGKSGRASAATTQVQVQKTIKIRWTV